MNPSHNIFVIYASTVGFVNKTKLPILDAILSYNNIFLTTVDPVTYAMETPLEYWMKDSPILKSDHVKMHTNDYMRAERLVCFHAFDNFKHYSTFLLFRRQPFQIWWNRNGLGYHCQKKFTRFGNELCWRGIE